MAHLDGYGDKSLTLNFMGLFQDTYRDILNFFRVLPYGVPAWSLERRDNQVSAANTIYLIKHQLGLIPETLIDVGARNSEWAYWLHREWPHLNIRSFEPNLACSPLGHWHKCALSDRQGAGRMSKASDVQITERLEKGKGEDFEIVRFDSLNLSLRYPTVVKVDCEQYTAAALSGFGMMLTHSVDVVVVEMWNNHPVPGAWPNQQAAIWATMLSHGFNKARVVDAAFGYRGIYFYDIAFFKGSVS